MAKEKMMLLLDTEVVKELRRLKDEYGFTHSKLVENALKYFLAHGGLNEQARGNLRF